MNVLGKIKLRLGDLWWYTMIFFIVSRFGDAINFFIGLWLVPKYVPQEELGALLPLTQVGGVMALPLTVLTITFTKYINVFAARGEFGKVRRLLRDTFCLVLVLFGISMFFMRLFMPFVFERMRISDGRLGLLVVASSVLGAVAPFFNSAVQALKMFRFSSLTGFFAAPLRLIALLICLPVRALSGYFIGQIVPLIYSIAVSLFGLRSFLFNKGLKQTPYLYSDGRAMFRFAAPILIGSLCLAPQGVVESLVIRHRLADVDSAAFYIISRFAEMGAFLGASMTYVLFPMASEQHEKGGLSQRLVLNCIAGTLATGTALAVVFFLFGKEIMLLVHHGNTYQAYIPHLAVLTVIMTVRCAFQCFTMNEIACRRFNFFWWTCAFSLMNASFLYGITGFEFFAPWVPAGWLQQVSDFNPRRLEFILEVMLITSLFPLCFMAVYLFVQRKRFRKLKLS